MKVAWRQVMSRNAHPAQAGQPAQAGEDDI
jgi:hypothetical protein